MGIQAPSTSDQLTIAYSAILYGNRPIILSLIFIVSLILSYALLKKSKNRNLISLLISGAIALLTAVYFIITTLSDIRY